MPKLPNASALPALALDAASPAPLFRQIYAGVRDLILSGRLKPGQALPSTRAFAAERGISRNTVVAAFEQLCVEGYVESRVGDATRVAAGSDRTARRDLPQTRRAPRRPRYSVRGAMLAGAQVSQPVATGATGLFRAGVPALDAFPFALWARLAARRWR